MTARPDYSDFDPETLVKHPYVSPISFVDIDPHDLIKNPNMLKQHEDCLPIGQMYNTVINPKTTKRFIRLLPKDYDQKKTPHLICACGGEVVKDRHVLSAAMPSDYFSWREDEKFNKCFFSLNQIPGTIGGMIYNNASCAKCISEYLTEVDVVMRKCDYDFVFKKVMTESDGFATYKITKKECKFGFRTSIFREMRERGIFCIIVFATFVLPERIPTITNQQKSKAARKEDMYFKAMHEKTLREWDPLGCKGCVYRDVYSATALPKDIERHNLFMSSYGRSFWIPNSKITFEDWVTNIKECEKEVFEKLGKKPNLEIEIIK